MRNIFLSLVMGLFLFSTATAQKGEKETIEGNGNLVTRTVPVQSFDALKASGIYELKLTQGSTEGVKIEADENLQELFMVRNDGSKLIIDMKKLEGKNLKTKNKMRVYITFRKLKSMDLSMVGNVSAEDALSFDDVEVSNSSVGHVNLKLNANKINLENKSVGNLTLIGKAQNAVLRNNGVGSINAGNFLVQTMDIDNSGIGSAEVNAEKELKVKDSFLGKVKNKGAAPVRKMNKVVI
ncbi:MAG: DUF2807 domain-containing protein [Flavisolibacter sp.]|nr:DUF2807 domain-containing protein [Flavisolibacter sp.]